MTVRLLAPDQVASLQAAALTYPEVGATRFGRAGLPAGYRHLRRSRTLPASLSWQKATEALLRWQVPDRAGLRVQASSAVIEQGSVGVLSAGFGPVSVRAPVRVVYLHHDESEDRQQRSCSFAYGTLPGHPEIGEEAFALEQDADGRIRFTITAFSRPGTLATRAAGPLGGALQSAVTARYLRSLDRSA